MELLGGIDFEIDKELLLGVEGTDALGPALLALVLGPEGVVGIGGQLTEAVLAVGGGDAGLDGIGSSILQIHDCFGERLIAGTEHLALDYALGIGLGEGHRAG